MPIPKRIRWISGYIEVPETHWQVRSPASFNSAYMCFAGQDVWAGIPNLKLEFQTEVGEGALSGYFLNPITSLASITINQTTYTATATINPGVEVRGDGTNSQGSKGGLSLTLNMRSSETYYGSRNTSLFHLYRAMYSSVTYRYIWNDCPLYSFSQLAGTIDVDTSRTYTKNDTDTIFQNVENVHSQAPHVQNIISNTTSINNALAVAITSYDNPYSYCTLVEQDALEFNYDYTFPEKTATSSYRNAEIAVEWIGYLDNMCLGTGMPIRKLNNFGDRITFDSFSNYGTMTPPNISPGYKMASHYDLGGTFRYTQTIWRNYSDPYTRDQWNCLSSGDYSNVSLTRNGTPTQSGYTFPDTTTASWHYESEDPTNIALVEFGTVLYSDRVGTVAASYDFATGTIHYSGTVSDIYPVKNNCIRSRTLSPDG